MTLSLPEAQFRFLDLRLLAAKTRLEHFHLRPRTIGLGNINCSRVG
jgi:hypothetical protein